MSDAAAARALAKGAPLAGNVLAGDMPLPLAVLDARALDANAAWMAAFCALNGLALAPHGKTTMAPALWDLQLRHGAWGITVATAQQLAVALAHGVPRVLWANQPVGRAAIAAAHAANARIELLVFADSLEGARALAGADRPLRVLVELGTPGGRTGARTPAAALEVARGVAATPGLLLAGLAAYEGLLPDATAADAFLALLRPVAEACAAEGLFGTEQVVLTAGGSHFFDRIAAALDFAPDGVPGRPVLKLLRSGCTLIHDHMGYGAAFARIRGDRGLRLPPGGLTPALELWAHVQSVPEPGRAIIGFGRRDAGWDAGMPVPIRLFRPGRDAAPVAFGAFHRIVALNDQHAHLTGPTERLRVGDMLAFGLGHPCSTFDRWRFLPLCDADLNVTSVIETWF